MAKDKMDHARSVNQITISQLAIQDFVQAILSSLETQQIIKDFANTLKKYIDFDSYDFKNPLLNISFGTAKANYPFHNSYKLKIDNIELGQLIIFRQKQFSLKEAQQLDEYITLLLYPLKNAYTHYKVLQSTLYDPLTRLHNRKILDETLAREFTLFKRYQHPLTLLSLDIDNFKNINDSYGHVSGDIVLKNIGQIIINAIRDSDIAFRLGGEEFLIIANNTTLMGAKEIASRIQKIVQKDEINTNNQSIKYSLSIGIAQAKQQDTPTSLLSRSDKALYQAKNLGKNRFHTL